MKLLMKILKQ